MNEKKILFFYQFCQLGGAELLIAKFSKNLPENYSVGIVCTSVSDDIKREFNLASVDTIIIDSWNKNEVFLAIINKFDCFCSCVTFLLNDYIMIRSLSSKVKKRTILYCLHPFALFIDTQKIFIGIKKRLAVYCLKRALKENKIVVMDEAVINSSQIFYGKDIDFSGLYSRITRIFVDDLGFDNDTIKEKLNSKIFNILTVARAELPFKGYLVGLIRDFPSYADEQTYLNFVTYGSGVERLMKELMLLPVKDRSRITIHEKKAYSELIRLIDEADLYVGMGTTLLDASIRKVISIPVQAYTEKVHANSYFFSDYKHLDNDGKGENDFVTLVKNLIFLKRFYKNEFIEGCNLSRDVVLKHYEAKRNTHLLLNEINGMSADDFCFVYKFIVVLKKIKSFFK